MAKLNIIIPVFNQFIFTEQCLKDLSYLNENHKVIIINNGSTDNSETKIGNLLCDFGIERCGCKFQLINSDTNLGFSRANNLAFKHIDADTSYVIFLNNDIRVSSKHLNNWTDIIIDNIEKYPNTLFSPTAGLLDDNFNFIYETQKPTDKWNYLSGWCLYGSVKTFDAIAETVNNEIIDNGPFSEKTFAYFEDGFMSFQAKHQKINLKLTPEIEIKHIGRITGKTLNLPNLYKTSREIFIKEFKKRGFGL